MGAYKYIRKLWEQRRKTSGTVATAPDSVAKGRHGYANRTSDKNRPRSHARIQGKAGLCHGRARVSEADMKTAPQGSKKAEKIRFCQLQPEKSKQVIAEEKAARKFPNLEVLNSYWVGEDGPNMLRDHYA